MRARRKVRKRFMDTVETGGLSVAKALYDFMNDEALPETGLTVERFWDGLGAIIRDFAPRNRKLLDLRDTLQARIDDFHRARRGRPFDVAEYERFLHDIEYLAKPLGSGHRKKERSAPSLRADQLIDKGAIIGE